MSHSLTIAITTGGSGGHVVPAMATAVALIGKGYSIDFYTDARGKRFVEPMNGLNVIVMPGSSPSGNPIHIIRGLASLSIATSIALGRMLRRRPRAIVGFGSYASFSACAAAIILRIPLFLHEQNAVLGRANESLHRFARKVITSVPNVEGIERVPAAKVIEAGYPIRSSIAALAKVPYPVVDPEGPLVILSTGGSQGAQVFGDVLPAALAELTDRQRARIRLTLQVKDDQHDRVRRQLDNMGMPTAAVATFFGDIPERLALAHLVICRSGMSTVAENLAAGRPAVYVPLPHGHRLEQYKNPAAAVKAGGAWLCEQKHFTPQWLANRLKEMLASQVDLPHMAHLCKKLGHPDAANAVADVVLNGL